MNLLSFGEIIWDVFPEKTALGGAPLNLAAYVAGLGDNAYILSTVGTDQLGKDAIDKINNLNIKTDYIELNENTESGKCIVSLDDCGIPTYNILDNVAYDYIEIPNKELNFDVLSFGTLALRHNKNLNTLKTIISNNKFKDIFVDVNIRAPFYTEDIIKFAISNATILKISDEELPVIKNVLNINLTENKDILILISKLYNNLKLIILTKGSKGSTAYSVKENIFYNSPAVPTNVISTVGAGDSFSGSFLHKYYSGNNIKECLDFAAKVSSIVCSKAEAVSLEIINEIQKI